VSTGLTAAAKPIIGMIHVAALPGTPRHGRSIPEIVGQAVDEARQYTDAAVDAVLIENMHDLPYLNGAVGPEIIAALTAVAVAVRSTTPLPLGVQVLAAANREALSVAHASGADFIRAENFVFAHVADEGLMPQAAAGPLLRFRRQIGAERIRIFADIRKKHASHALTADVALAELARAAEFSGADGIIITGAATGCPAAPADVASAKQAVQIPVWVGSGVTAANIGDHWHAADGFIIGSAFKQDGVWRHPLDPARVRELVDRVRALRGRTA
jgi:membrane complex biogenesis BtpA family protein